MCVTGDTLKALKGYPAGCGGGGAGSGLWVQSPSRCRSESQGEGECERGGGRQGNEKAKRTNMPSHGGCYGLNCVPPNSYLGALSPCNSEYDGIWRQGLKRGDQFKTVIKMGPNPI